MNRGNTGAMFIDQIATKMTGGAQCAKADGRNKKIGNSGLSSQLISYQESTQEEDSENSDGGKR